MMDDIRAVLETLVPREMEISVKNGAWYLMRIRPYRTIENEIEGGVITMVDISARKRTEQALRSSEARLSSFINQAFAGVGEIDLGGLFLFVNDWLCTALGHRRENLLRMRLSEVTEPSDLPRLREEFESLAAGGTEARLEARFVRRDGTRIPVQARLSPMRAADGRVTSLLILAFDLQH